MKKPFVVAMLLALSLTALLVSVAVAGTLANIRMSNSSGGPEVTQFPVGTSVVYLVFDYTDMQGEEVHIVVYYGPPPALYDEIKTYSGSGIASIAISHDGEAFPEGLYATNLYRGGFLATTIIWEVTEDVGEVTPTPTATPTMMPTATPTGTATSYRIYLPVILKDYS